MTNTKTGQNKTADSVSIDGVDHINIYSRGNTELGRQLSHFAHSPFIHPFYGPFESMEGFWYWMRAGNHLRAKGLQDDKLRYLSGYKAKQYGKNFPIQRYEHFKEDILAANYQKILQHRTLHNLLVESTLPFRHYYMFGPGNVIVQPRDSNWLVTGFEDIRQALKQDRVPDCWATAAARYTSQIVDNQ